MKIFVTGGSGFIGTAVMNVLQERGWAACNYDIKPPLDPAHAAKYVHGDILDVAQMNNAMQGFSPDSVIHLAAFADLTIESWENFSSIHRGTENVLAAIDACSSVKRFVNISTQLVIGPKHKPRSLLDFRPYTVYGEAKAYAEAQVLQWNTDVQWLTYRPANIWGQRHPTFADQILKFIRKGVYLHPRGKVIRRTYGYVDNTAEQIVDLLLADPKQTHRQVFYGADAPLDTSIWIDAFAIALTGKRAHRVPIPLLRVLGLGGDVASKFGLPAPINSGRVMRMTEDYALPVEPTLAITGTPKYSLDEGVTRTVAWLKTLPEYSAI